MNMLDRNREEALARAQDHSYYEDEEWRICPGFPWYYISSYGQVYSVKSGRLISPVVNDGGYLQVGLVQGQWNYTRSVHVLVAQAYLEPDPVHTDVGHINGDYEDNRVENLVWTSRGSKVLRSMEYSGYRPRNEKAVRVVRDGEEQVFVNMTACAKYFGVTQPTVARWIADGRRRDGISIEFVE